MNPSSHSSNYHLPSSKAIFGNGIFFPCHLNFLSDDLSSANELNLVDQQPIIDSWNRLLSILKVS